MRNTHKLLKTAAVIMSVFLLATSMATALGPTQNGLSTLGSDGQGSHYDRGARQIPEDDDLTGIS